MSTLDINALRIGDRLVGSLDGETYQVIQTSPPHGRRKDALVIVLRLSDEFAYQLGRHELGQAQLDREPVFDE